MRIQILSLFVILVMQSAFSQNSVQEEKDSVVVDSLYRDDQFYLGFSFNLLTNKPEGIHQSGFSGGAFLGFIRDFPLNDRRNFGVGIGLGWAVNTYGYNLFIGENKSGETIFKTLKDVDYDRNRITTYLIEMPIEIRWRTSTATRYDFWRIYGGIKLGYIYYFKSNFEQPGYQVLQTQLGELQRFRLGATLSAGYNKVNFYFYYSFNPLFDGKLMDTGEYVGIQPLKFGLIFYIL